MHVPPAWENSRQFSTPSLVSRAMTSEKRTQKFHTVDVSLPKSGWCFWLVVHAENLLQPIRSTTQIWVVTHRQYGISALVFQTSFRAETSDGVAKCSSWFSCFRQRSQLCQNLPVDLRIQSLIEVTFVFHSTVMLGEFHTKDYRRNEEKQAVADGEPKTVLQSQKQKDQIFMDFVYKLFPPYNSIYFNTVSRIWMNEEFNWTVREKNLLYRHECFPGKYTTRKIHKNYIRDPSSLFSIISLVSLSMT